MCPCGLAHMRRLPWLRLCANTQRHGTLRSTIRAERGRCRRDAAWRSGGRKAGWFSGGRDGYGRHCCWRCGRRGCKSHASPMLAHGADGRRGNGNELRGGHADLEVVLRGGSGTGQYWQHFRPSPPLLPLRLHEPHRPLTVASVTRTSLRVDHGPSSPTRLNHAVSRLLSANEAHPRPSAADQCSHSQVHAVSTR